MKLRAEITVWSDNLKNGVYLTNDSGDTVYAYGVYGNDNLHYLEKPMKIDLRGRKFLDLYKWDSIEQGKKVVGSKGDVYYVVDNKCSCPGFKYRGVCKHV